MENKKEENKRAGRKKEETRGTENKKKEEKRPEGRQAEEKRTENRKRGGKKYRSLKKSGKREGKKEGNKEGNKGRNKENNKENNKERNKAYDKEAAKDINREEKKENGHPREDSRKKEVRSGRRDRSRDDRRRDDTSRDERRKEELKRADSRREEFRRAGSRREAQRKEEQRRKSGENAADAVQMKAPEHSQGAKDVRIAEEAQSVQKTREAEEGRNEGSIAGEVQMEKSPSVTGKTRGQEALRDTGKRQVEKSPSEDGQTRELEASFSADAADALNTQEIGQGAVEVRKAEADRETAGEAAVKETRGAGKKPETKEGQGALEDPSASTGPKAEDAQIVREAPAGQNGAETKDEGAGAKTEKVQVIGVRFRSNGKIYYFSAGDLPVKKDINVIVETARGVEYGRVVLENRVVEEKRIISTLKPVIRIATSEDDIIHENNKVKSREAFAICQEKIRKHGLEMKLIDCEYTFDNNKVLFYFTADGRIDFRELVKDLAAVFKTRIELRQIGVRDETKIMGGIGICGRPLCCHTYLSEFIPVSIKMAKEQSLSLNPTKISGACGRLMCCLKNEQDTYEYLNKKLPNTGDEVRLPEGGKGVVQSVNVLRQKVKVIITDEKDEKELVEYNARELNFHPRRKKDKGKIDGDLKKLEALEKKEKKSKADR